jgi:hypothetical protein
MDRWVRVLEELTFLKKRLKIKRNKDLRNFWRVPKQEQDISRVVGFTHNHNKMKLMHES